MAAIAASVVLAMVLMVHSLTWILLRLVTGVAFAGLYMVIESWLNESASNTNRGQLFATYMVIQLTAITIGQMLLPLGEPGGFRLFVLTAIAITLALVPVGLTTAGAPQPLGAVHLRLAPALSDVAGRRARLLLRRPRQRRVRRSRRDLRPGRRPLDHRRRPVHERSPDRRRPVPDPPRASLRPDRPAQAS